MIKQRAKLNTESSSSSFTTIVSYPSKSSWWAVKEKLVLKEKFNHNQRPKITYETWYLGQGYSWNGLLSLTETDMIDFNKLSRGHQWMFYINNYKTEVCCHYLPSLWGLSVDSPSCCSSKDTLKRLANKNVLCVRYYQPDIQPKCLHSPELLGIQ